METITFNKKQKTFVKNLFGVRLNGYGADLYTDKNGAAAILFDRNLKTIKNAGIFFKNINEAKQYVEQFDDYYNDANNLNQLLICGGIFSADE